MDKPMKRLGPPASGERFGIDDIGQILEMLRENGVTEFKIEREGEKLSIRRGTVGGPATAQVVAQPSTAFVGSPQLVPAVPAGAPILGEVNSAPVTSKKLHEIRSPMVGTFYRRPAVDADPYVNVGDMVKKGDVLCIVEAMKLMNEIESDVAGRVAEVCLEDGKMAEYSEVLFRIEPL